MKVTLLGVVACAVTVSPAFAGCPGFTTANTQAAGTSPKSVAAGDFNNDTRIDLAVANSGSNDVSILLRNPDGTFAPAVSYPAGTAPSAIVTADFNGDGKADLAVANSGSNNISILLGNGDGTFGTAVNYTVGTMPVSIEVIAPSNDLATANEGSNNVSVLHSNGNGTFAMAVNYAVDLAPVAVVTDHGNTAGNLFVANSGSNDMSTLLRQPNGTYAAAVNQAVGTNPTSIYAWTEISHMVAVTLSSADRVSVFYGDPGTTLTGYYSYDFPMGSDPVSVVATQLRVDQNGRPALVVAKKNSSAVSIFYRDMTTHLVAPVDVALPAQPDTMIAAGLNGDWARDLVFANSGSNNISVLLSDCPGGARGDVSADGKSDILWRNSASGQDALWYMNGTTISSGFLLLLFQSDTNWHVIGMGDFDGDTHNDDILWRNAQTGDSEIWRLSPDGNAQRTGFFATTDLTWKIAGLGDLDGDGHTDALWWKQSTGEVIVYYTQYPVGGNGEFVGRTTQSFGPVSDLNWTVAATGDFDGDAVDDVLWHNGATGENVIWFMSSSRAIRNAQYTYTVSDLNWQVAGAGDFDGDGKADLVWWNPTTGDVVVWLMDGANILTAAHVTTVNNTSWHIEALGDFDGDGKTDLAWRNVSTGDVVIWLMNGVRIKQAAYVTTTNDTNWQIVGPH